MRYIEQVRRPVTLEIEDVHGSRSRGGDPAGMRLCECGGGRKPGGWQETGFHPRILDLLPDWICEIQVPVRVSDSPGCIITFPIHNFSIFQSQARLLRGCHPGIGSPSAASPGKTNRVMATDTWTGLVLIPCYPPRRTSIRITPDYSLTHHLALFLKHLVVLICLPLFLLS